MHPPVRVALALALAGCAVSGCVAPAGGAGGNDSSLMHIADQVIGQAKDTAALESDHGDQVRAIGLALTPRNASASGGWGLDARLNGTDSLGRELRFAADVTYALFANVCPRADGLGSPLATTDAHPIPETFAGDGNRSAAFTTALDLERVRPGEVVCATAAVDVAKSGARFWVASAPVRLAAD
ncbi:MAG: hypothetical protein ACYDCK_11345 [Thermoplasmatota archaeon]